MYVGVRVSNTSQIPLSEIIATLSAMNRSALCFTAPIYLLQSLSCWQRWKLAHQPNKPNCSQKPTSSTEFTRKHISCHHFPDDLANFLYPCGITARSVTVLILNWTSTRLILHFFITNIKSRISNCYSMFFIFKPTYLHTSNANLKTRTWKRTLLAYQ